MKALSVLAALLLRAAPVFGSEPLLSLSSDASTYVAGATANLTAVALVTPQSSTDSLYIGATLNGTAISVNQSTNGIGYCQTPALLQGLNTWTVQLYLEDTVFSTQLTNTINILNLQDAQLMTELSQNPTPAQQATIQAQLAQNYTAIQETGNELALIRRPFGPSQSLTFYAE